MTTDYLSLEWQTLQNQFDSYEKYSLLIKLVAIFTTSFALGFEFNLLVPVLMVGVFWLQDGIWKTFQARFEARLLIVEAALAANHNETGCQFNQQYQQTANSGAGLIKEYLNQCLRPTVMYPYVILLGLTFSCIWW